MSSKCSHCGCVNWSADKECRRCQTPLETPVQHSLKNPFHAGHSSSYLTYWMAFLFGCGICVGLFVSTLVIYPHEPPLPFPILLWIIYAVAGFCLSLRRRANPLFVGLFLSTGYILVTFWGISQLLDHNEKYGGWFWTNKFFFWPVVLYSWPPIVATLAAYLSARRSAKFAGILLGSLAIGVIALIGSRPGEVRVRRITHSFNIVAGESRDVIIKVDMALELATQDEPTEFRTVPAVTDGHGASQTITVVSKNAAFNPTIHLFTNIDGKSLDNSMWPINQPDGSSHVDFGRPQDYRQIVHWNIGPNADLLAALANAHHISIDWGNLHTELPEDDVKNLRNFVRSYFQILAEERALCTNPNCKQPLDSGKQ